MDIVAWHPATQTLLLIEVKTRIVDLQDLIGTLDRKERVVPALLAAERGWNARSLGVMLVAPDTSATRRAIARHAATFAAALPQRGAAVRRWLDSPSGRLRGIWLLSDSRRV